MDDLMVNPLRNFVKQRRKPRRPSDFETDGDFLRHVRETFTSDLDADRHNRDEMLTDLEFFAGKQWDDDTETAREALGKPTLTINRLVAFVGQLAGNRRLNSVVARVLPDASGDKQVAEIREGLIRNIQKVCKAGRVYDRTYQNLVTCGVGNFQISLDFADDDVFEQDIKIVGINNPLSVVWDHESVDPTGADAKHVFVVDMLKREEFEKRYPDADVTSTFVEDTNLQGQLRRHGWLQGDTVRVVSYWRLRKEKRIVALMQDGDVVDMTDREVTPELIDQIQVDQDDGLPIVRETQRRFAEMYLLSGNDILAGPYRLNIRRVPVFRAQGWEVDVGDSRVRFGLVRFLRDPQRLHNYWRSVIAEKLMRAPKQSFIAAEESIQGRENEWRTAHLSNDSLLMYSAEGGPRPELVPPAQLESALINEAGVAAQDIRDVSNIQEAALGIKSNEVSGRALMARQRVAELGSIIYNDNMNAAIEEAADVINQLIPEVYDTPRIIRVLGPGEIDNQKMVSINDLSDPNSVNITAGKYSVTLVTGPSLPTKRIEAAEHMMAMVNAMPQTMTVAADKIVESQDWPGAEEIARRLRLTLPPGMLSPADTTPEMRAAQMQQAQAQQQQAQFAQAVAQAELSEKQARAVEAIARARQAEAVATRNEAEAGIVVPQAEAEARSMQFNDMLKAVSTFNDVTARGSRND